MSSMGSSRFAPTKLVSRSLGSGTRRQRRRPISLFTQIVAMVAVVLASGTLLLGAVSIALLRHNLLASVDEGLQHDAGVISAKATVVDANTDRPGDKLVPTSAVVQIYHSDGSPGTTITGLRSQNDPVPQLPSMGRSVVIDRNQEPFTWRDPNGNEWRIVAAPFASTTEYSFAVATPIDSIQGTVEQMVRLVFLVTIAVVFGGTILGGFAAHRALRPLANVEATAAEIADGDLSRRVPETRSSFEVNRLSTSLNEMLGQIETAFDERAASEERMRRFVADASHELRTPLAAIRGFGELYRMGALATPDDVSSAMRRIEDESIRMGSLVEDLLHLARLDDNPPLEMNDLDLVVLASDAAEVLRAIDPTRRVRVVPLSRGRDLSPTSIIGNDPGLRQVVTNLVGNAARHTAEGQNVELAVGFLDGETARLEVRDHGAGIAPEQADRVFERFYRTDSSRERGNGGGAGLGLAIAATIVSAHRGRIDVVETAGGGATFRVDIPIVQNADQDSTDPAVASRAG